jgi:hypothetical protein
MSPEDSRGRPTDQATGADSAGRASACALCGRPPGSEAAIRTTEGGIVHVACADRAALRAWQRRRWAALGHAVIAALSLLALSWWAGVSFALLAVALAWGGLHLIAHRRFWHYLFRDLRRRLRRHT